MIPISRRHFLAGTMALAASAALPATIRNAWARDGIRLAVTTRTLEVKGKAATVYGLSQSDGSRGFVGTEGGRFALELDNRLSEPTLVHWHGMTPPWRQDGVPDVTQKVLAPGARYAYDFPLDRVGTHWMHSHYGLQKQNLMSAPLIVRSKDDLAADEQEVIVELADFSFTPAVEILAGLRNKAPDDMSGMGGMDGMDHAAMGYGDMAMSMPGMTMPGMTMPEAAPMPGMKKATSGVAGAGDPTAAPMAMTMDVNDVEYDAYLANDRSLDDPQVIEVERGGIVRLRIINAASSTNFTIDLGNVEGDLIAVDGNPVKPVRLSRFPLAMAQRADIRVRMPGDGQARPVLFLCEGSKKRTGIVLRSPQASVEKVAETSLSDGPGLDLAGERTLVAAMPPANRKADRTILFDLTGSMDGYVWGWKADRPLMVRDGEGVEMVLRNTTMMSHPMHLHGHHFQVVAIDGQRMQGAIRDTVFVPPNGSVTIAFDADNPGRWAFHCHNLYHMAVGMMTTIDYEGV